MAEIMLVNQTGADLRGVVEAAVLESIRNGGQLPEEIADLFNLEIVNVNGQTRGLLTWK